MTEISLVVPIYNVEKYLPQCLDSLRAQSLRDIEIICVVDGATDRSGIIADMFASVDDRIVVIHKTNGGVSSARNAGIRAARGRIICFVDPDDMLLPKACEVISRTFAENDADIVTFGAYPWPNFHDNPWLHNVLSPRKGNYKDFSIDLLLKEKASPFVWNMAIRKDFLESVDICFDETILFGEDQVFNFAIFPRAKRFSFIDDKLYLYRIDRIGSLMDSRYCNLRFKYEEHVAVADSITADWSKQGYLELYGKDLLLWSIDFLVPPLDNLTEEDRVEVMERVSDYWAQWFGEDAAATWNLDGSARQLMAVVTQGRANSEEFSQAVQAFLGTIAPTAKEPLGRRIRLKLKKILPLPASVAEARLSELEDRIDWQVEDAAACSQSLALLEAELLAHRRQNE